MHKSIYLFVRQNNSLISFFFSMIDQCALINEKLTGDDTLINLTTSVYPSPILLTAKFPRITLTCASISFVRRGGGTSRLRRFPW